MNHWIIKILICCYFFAIFGCDKNEIKKITANGNLKTVTTPEITKKFNKDIQVATIQFTTKLNEILEQATAQFQNNTEKTLKKIEEQQNNQIIFHGKKLINKLNEIVQIATIQFTTKLNEILEQATAQFQNNTEKTLKKIEEQQNNQITSHGKKLTNKLNEIVQIATTQFTKKLNETVTKVNDDFMKSIGEAATTAKNDVTNGIETAATKTKDDFIKEMGEAVATTKDNVTTQTAINRFTTDINAVTARFTTNLADQVQQLSKLESQKPALDVTTQTINTIKLVIQSALKNSEMFLYLKIEKLVKKTIEEMKIQWTTVLTEQDKEELTGHIIDTIKNEMKYHLKNIKNALNTNIKKAVHQQSEILIKRTIPLAEKDIRELSARIDAELEIAIEQSMDDIINYAVGQTIDAETAKEAVYTLQFDLVSTLPHKNFGKPISLFISIEKEEASEEISFSFKGDCAKIKKEYLPFAKLILMYMNPVLGMNFPSSIIEFCNSTIEDFKCKPGNYNIQKTGEEQNIDYVLKWKKSEANNTLPCQQFPKN